MTLEIVLLNGIGLFTKEEAGDSLEKGEAPEDTIENVDKHKCSEIELELLTVFVQTIV